MQNLYILLKFKNYNYNYFKLANAKSLASLAKITPDPKLDQNEQKLNKRMGEIIKHIRQNQRTIYLTNFVE